VDKGGKLAVPKEKKKKQLGSILKLKPGMQSEQPVKPANLPNSEKQEDIAEKNMPLVNEELEYIFALIAGEKEASNE